MKYNLLITRKLLVNTLIITSLLISCKEDENPINTGEIDFSNYVAVGNSLTAGYSDGGLYREVQSNSYPSIFATQIGTTITQPLMPPGNGSGYVYLTSYVDGIPGINFLQEDPAAFNKVSGTFHNLGIPGIRIKDVDMKDYGLEVNNPYFYRILPQGSEANSSYLDLLKERNPTFFTCWLGNNDILGYATGGGADGIEGNGQYGLGGLTEPSLFESNYQQVIDELTKNNAKGVVITIPDISLIPFFNLVSNDNFPSLSENLANELEEIYSEINEKIEEYNNEIASNPDLSDGEKQELTREMISFSVSGNNAFVIVDNDLPDINKNDSEGNPIPRIRHLTDDDRITLNGVLELTDVSKLSGIVEPLNDEYALTTSELQIIEEYRIIYNDIIRDIVNSPGIAIIEANDILGQFVSGKTIDGELITTQFIEGGLFSIDGVHLTARGYAIVANEIIKAINQKFSAQIPLANISQYNAVNIP